MLAFAFCAHAAAATAPVRLPPPQSADAPADFAGVHQAAWLEGETPCPCPPVTYAAPEFELGVQFDKGLFIRSTDLDERPFSIYAGARLQVRYTGFARDRETWTDAAGVTRTIRNRSNFDTERARLNLSGTALSPDLRYAITFDGDSDGASNVDNLFYFFAYQLTDTVEVAMGRWKVASTRQWLQSSRHLRMVDRSLATEYFRPGFSDGLWLWGKPADGVRWQASLTNGLRTSTRRPADLDDNLAIALTGHIEPWAAYGTSDVDFQCHATPAVRLGASFLFDRTEDRSDAGFPLGDDNFLRLSDGTRLSDTGALAPGVRLLSDHEMVASFDAGLKYQGWSLSGEYFMRWIQGLEADGALPVRQLYDYGFHAELGKFLIAKRVDVNARMSQVSGLRGDSLVYSLGTNYYFGRRSDDLINKFSLDVLAVKGAAVTTSTADFVAGDSGLMVRAQTQLAF
ncbi:porin [Pseudobythopirellula maris]|nr:porin [Pseudobythopirellula maris]